MRAGYPVAIILHADRLEYFNALEKSCVDRDYSDFTEWSPAVLHEALTCTLR